MREAEEIHKDLILYGDGRRITQVFQILLDNAIKYSFKNSKIIISVKNNDFNKIKNENGVLIQIIDKGRGIQQTEIPKLFHRYYRASNVKDIAGTGLGLSIANSIVQAHRGDISVESELGKGSIFSVFLPKLEQPPKK